MIENGLQLALVIAGIGGTLGGFAGYFAKARAEAVIALLTKENDVLKDANTRLEKEAAAKDAVNAQQKQQIDTLTGLAQGSPQLIKLTGEIKSLVAYIKKRGTT